jgi:hypothetical protein
MGVRKEERFRAEGSRDYSLPISRRRQWTIFSQGKRTTGVQRGSTRYEVRAI